MKRLLIVFFALAWGFASAQEWKARVVDDSLRPVAYTNIYLKNNPAQGVLADLDGNFTFSLQNTLPEDLIYISRVGYELYVLPVEYLLSNPISQIVLREQPILLQDVIVYSKKRKRVSKKKAERMQLEEVLDKIYSRMEVDFPRNERSYNIASHIQLTNTESEGYISEWIGQLTELPRQSNPEKDTLVFQKQSSKQTLSERLNTFTEESDNQDSLIILPHKFLWKMNARRIMMEFKSDVKNWSILDENEEKGQMLLMYRRKMNFLGIIKFDVKFKILVDTKIYSLDVSSQEISLLVNIPFGGYKLDTETMEILNAFTVSSQQLEQFKVKKLIGYYQMNERYQGFKNEKRVTEKDMDANLNLFGKDEKEKESILFKSMGRIKVTGYR